MTADRPATEPRTEAGRQLLNKIGALSRAYTPENKSWRDTILAIEAEAAQRAARLTRDDRTNAKLPPSAPDEVVRWMRNNDLVAVTRRAYDDVRWGAAPRAEGLETVTIPRAEYEALMRYDEGRAAEYARLSRPSDD